MCMDTLKTIGLALKHRRHQLGLNQDQLSYNSGVERTYISGIENGRKNVSLSVFLRLCKALDVKPWDLLKESLD